VRRLAPLVLLVLAACSGLVVYEQQECDLLYFGTAKPDGSAAVTETEWQQFLREEVTPRFAGFTHWEANGSWKDVPEKTHILQIVHPQGHEADIAAIMDAYKKRFAQEAVLQVRGDVWLRLR